MTPKEKALALIEAIRKVDKIESGYLYGLLEKRKQMLSDFEDEKEFLVHKTMFNAECGECKFNHFLISERIKDLDSAIEILKGGKG